MGHKCMEVMLKLYFVGEHSAIKELEEKILMPLNWTFEHLKPLPDDNVVYDTFTANSKML